MNRLLFIVALMVCLGCAEQTPTKTPTGAAGQLEPKPTAGYAGFFFVEGNGYVSNGRTYCLFPSFQLYLAWGGPAEYESVNEFAQMPPNLSFRGDCRYTGFAFVAGVGYYFQQAGDYCHFDTFDQYLAAGGDLDPAKVPEFSEIPRGSTHTGLCQLESF